MAGVSRVVIQEPVDELKTLMHQQVRTGDKERIQLLYLLKSGQAESVTHAAEIPGRGRVTLQRWLAKYEENGIDGLLHRQPCPGRACQIPPTAQQHLVERLRYGIVEPATGASFFYEFSHLDTACFECFLQLVSQTYPDVLNVIQLDQAPAHCSDTLGIPDNIVLLYQPAHSPELNPIERVWQDLKLDFKGENFATLDGLRVALRETLSYMTPEWIASMTQYRYIMRALSISITS